MAHLQPADGRGPCLDPGRDDGLRSGRELRRRRSGRPRLSALGALNEARPRASRVPGDPVETFALKSPYGFLDNVADSIRGPM